MWDYFFAFFAANTFKKKQPFLTVIAITTLF